MKSLNRIINVYLRRLAGAIMVIILVIAVSLQVVSAQNQARDNAQATFVQISQLLQQNKTELAAVEAEYRETCLLNAETIAYMIRTEPALLGDVEAFRQLAYMLEVDEIHIFDKTGRIFTGTHPEYFDMTFDSGDQIGFFKPMMHDKSMRLCQDITPNTAEARLVQYSALWSSDGEFIVQVGMYPDAVLEATEKNELSYIFSLLQGNPGISLYAIDPLTGEVVGSSSGTDNGKPLSQLGLSVADLERYQKGAHVMVNGVNSFCVFEDAEGTLIGYVISNDSLFGHILWYTAVMALGLALVAMVLLFLLGRLINQYISGSITQINARLRAIGAGDLSEQANVRSSLEFSELSDHINQMVQSLLASTTKMGIVLDRAKLLIGVYEYNTAMKTVRFTEHVPEIFGLSSRDMAVLASDYTDLQTFIRQLRQEPIPERENTYRFMGKRERYLTLEEVSSGNDVLGIVMDVTEQILSLKRAETERDMDLLTGLYNRRGIMNQLEAHFAADQDRGHGALVMFDSDGLKQVNDTYGHMVGDAYLKHLADLLRDFAAPAHFAGRLGGDEFLMVIHGYTTEPELLEALSRLRYLQKNTIIPLENGTQLPLHFSFGYVLTQGRRDYHAMISEADGYMYNVKRLRKQSLSGDGE